MSAFVIKMDVQSDIYITRRKFKRQSHTAVNKYNKWFYAKNRKILFGTLEGTDRCLQCVEKL